MPRQARIVSARVPHQIGTRGNNKRRLFSYPADYLRFIGFVQAAQVVTRCALHQLTLMANHIHMIVTPPTATALATFMKRTLQRYATWRNAERGTTGKLFEQRFFSASLEEPLYLARATLYNDANLAVAGLIADPADHRWSTCGIHCGVPERSAIPLSMWTPSPWYLALGRPDERPLHYRRLLLAYLSAPELDVDPAVVEFERGAMEHYTRRIERPDGSSAREPKIALWSKTRKDPEE